MHFSPPKTVTGKNENAYLSSDNNHKNKSFKKYVEIINNYPNNYFDLIIIDGRARNACMNHALSKVKNNGFILLDNSEREEYVLGANLLKDFCVETFFGPGFYNNYQWESKIYKIEK